MSNQAHITTSAVDRERISADDAAIVEALLESITSDHRISHLSAAPLPSRDKIVDLLNLLRDLVFPGFFTWRQLRLDSLVPEIGRLVAHARQQLETQVRAVLSYTRHGETNRPMEEDCPKCAALAAEIARTFFEQLPGIRSQVSMDVQAAYDGDPAATHTDETIFCYPGVRAMMTHRLTHALLQLETPLLPRMMSEIAHARTGIDIHPGAKIGRGLFIDHGTGVVIGETTTIGDHVKIYQGVTLGAKSFPKDERGRLIRGRQRHPTIGHRVTIYAGATILGGDTIIGDDCIIGGGVFVTESVPAGHVVVQKKPELRLLENRDLLGRASPNGTVVPL
jgi:serine O-acetyltransferase